MQPPRCDNALPLNGHPHPSILNQQQLLEDTASGMKSPTVTKRRRSKRRRSCDAASSSPGTQTESTSLVVSVANADLETIDGARQNYEIIDDVEPSPTSGVPSSDQIKHIRFDCVTVPSTDDQFGGGASTAPVSECGRSDTPSWVSNRLNPCRYGPTHVVNKRCGCSDANLI